MAQAVFDVSFFFLPSLSIELFGIHFTGSLYEILENPLLQLSGFHWPFIVCCVIVFVPLLFKSRRSWLTLLAPVVILLVLGLNSYLKLREFSDGIELYGDKSLNWPTFLHLGSGAYGILISALILAVQGLRKALRPEQTTADEGAPRP